jgi:glycosyltransferase involved in cell wall biosynthesis
MAGPEVTYLMSVYNGRAYLAAAIDSLLAQTVSDWKLVVVDDASTDDSPAIVEGYGDSRVRLIRMEVNQGQTAALNEGLRHVTSTWVSRIDADDLAYPRRLEHLLQCIKTREDVVLVGTKAAFVDETGALLGYFDPPLEEAEIRDMLRFKPRLNPFAHSTISFRTRVVEAIGGYPRGFEMAEDYALWLMLAERGRIANLCSVDAAIRIHAGQKTTGIRGLEVYSHVLRAHSVLVQGEGKDLDRIEAGRAEVALHALALALRLHLPKHEFQQVLTTYKPFLGPLLRHPGLLARVASRGLKAARSRGRTVEIDWS